MPEGSASAGACVLQRWAGRKCGRDVMAVEEEIERLQQLVYPRLTDDGDDVSDDTEPLLQHASSEDA